MGMGMTTEVTGMVATGTRISAANCSLEPTLQDAAVGINVSYVKSWVLFKVGRLQKI